MRSTLSVRLYEDDESSPCQHLRPPASSSLVSTSVTTTIMPTSVSITKCIACLGIMVSSLSLAPVIYTHMTARDHSTLLPFLGTLQVRGLGAAWGNAESSKELLVGMLD